jgi:hypothetical protein
MVIVNRYLLPGIVARARDPRLIASPREGTVVPPPHEPPEVLVRRVAAQLVEVLAALSLEPVPELAGLDAERELASNRADQLTRSRRS